MGETVVAYLLVMSIASKDVEKAPMIIARFVTAEQCLNAADQLNNKERIGERELFAFCTKPLFNT